MLQHIIEALKWYLFYFLFQTFRYTCIFIKSRLNNVHAMKFIKDKYVLITGATDGIGKALAYNLAKRGIKIIITGRNEQKIADIENDMHKKGFYCKGILLDFSTSDLKLKGLFDSYDIGLLINNAGCCSEGPADFVKDSMVTDIVNVNVLNTFRLTQEILKDMVFNNRGYIVNIGSITGDFAVPYLVAYSSSKAMIKSWSESLYYELMTKNIVVDCFDTGYVCTKMSKIRKSSFFVPSAEEYADCLVKSFGCGNICFAYYPHLLLFLVISHLPRFLVARVSYLKQYSTKKYIESRRRA
ncbi:hypothetical protein EDEG_02188 [Edhazardia aedis USNM 41457]|uniref:Uncharacterized protein n=1 Tax=Edhazardia aedis (strain USNM 41457) TaxID=1003232 RepID=J9DQ50_EDHAE|nr:hypothetical protein EDEG_02188 [Edhazardia aedis USNM 41457]|eukprot:EJW03477.1 hypothetical protein EDEG_02188 [Edhazardia aedis USNM 41457]